MERRLIKVKSVVSYMNSIFFKKQIFNFKIVLDLKKSCKDGIQFSYTPHPIFPLVNTLHYYTGHLSWLRQQHGYLAINQTHTLFRFHVFPLTSNFCSRFPFKISVTFGCHVSLTSSGLWRFLSLCLLLMTFTDLRTTCQVLGTMSLSLGLSDIFLIIRLKSWVSEKTTGMTTSSQGKCFEHDLLLLNQLGFIHLHAVKPAYCDWIVVKCNVGAKHQSQESRQLVLKSPELTKGFQGKVLKDKVREGCVVFDQLMDLFLIGWWCDNGESILSDF